MAIKRPIRHIIKEYYNNYPTTFEVLNSSVTGTPAVTTIQISNILHLRAGLIVTIDTVNYTVASVSGSGIFTVVANLTSPALVTISKPVWFAGSPLYVNKKRDELPAASKVPALWLYEVIRERVMTVPDSAIERVADIRLFVLDETNPDWDASDNQDDCYTYLLDGLCRFAEYIVEGMWDDYRFAHFDEYTITPFARFGVYVENKGVLNSVFNENLSGVEITISLPVNNRSC